MEIVSGAEGLEETRNKGCLVSAGEASLTQGSPSSGARGGVLVVWDTLRTGLRMDPPGQH